MSWINGYKTYLCAVLLGLATVARALGYIDDATYATLAGLLGAGGLASLRHGLSNNH